MVMDAITLQYDRNDFVCAVVYTAPAKLVTDRQCEENGYYQEVFMERADARGYISGNIILDIKNDRPIPRNFYAVDLSKMKEMINDFSSGKLHSKKPEFETKKLPDLKKYRWKFSDSLRAIGWILRGAI